MAEWSKALAVKRPSCMEVAGSTAISLTFFTQQYWAKLYVLTHVYVNSAFYSPSSRPVNKYQLQLRFRTGIVASAERYSYILYELVEFMSRVLVGLAITIMINHHHHHHRFNVRFSMLAQVGRFLLPNKPPHLALSCAHSALSFKDCRSRLTHSPHVFMVLPLPFDSATSKLI